MSSGEMVAILIVVVEKRGRLEEIKNAAEDRGEVKTEDAQTRNEPPIFENMRAMLISRQSHASMDPQTNVLRYTDFLESAQAAGRWL